MERPVAVADHARLFIEGIIQQGKALFGHVDMNLEGDIPHADSVGQEISVGAVPAPQEVLRLHLRRHTK